MKSIHRFLTVGFLLIFIISSNKYYKTKEYVCLEGSVSTNNNSLCLKKMNKQNDEDSLLLDDVGLVETPNTLARDIATIQE